MFRLILVSAILAFVSSAAHADTLVFRNACASGDRLKIAAVGDLIFHKQLLAQIFNRRRPVEAFWAPLQDVFNRADITYGNLEGPVAPGITAGGRKVRRHRLAVDYRVYGYRLPNVSFNFPPSVLDGLKAGGFDIVSTANNHALDRGVVGLELTIDGLHQRRLLFSGTRKRGANDEGWATITHTKGFRVAWLACTYSTNGLPDRHGQVLACYGKQQEILSEIKTLSSDPSIDAVLVTPHWGQENQHRPNARQRRFARLAIEAGALAVIGSHPHVLQPWEKHVAADGREGLIVYSTGNFLSNQRHLMQRAGVVVTLELARTSELRSDTRSQRRKPTTILSGAGYVPTWVVIDRKGHTTVANQSRNSAALRWTQRILPPGNKVAAAAPFRLPKTCGAQALHATAPLLVAGRSSLRRAPAAAPTKLARVDRRQDVRQNTLKLRLWIGRAHEGD